MIGLIIYMVLGYWAAGKTVYANKVIIYSGSTFFARRVGVGLIGGWILIPIACIKPILGQ